MRPKLTANDKRDRHLANANGSSYSFLLFPSAKEKFDFSDLALGKLCVSISRSNIARLWRSLSIFVMPPSIDAIADVVSLRSLPQMARIEAGRIVTRMKHEQSAENSPVHELERKSRHAPIFALESDDPISTCMLFVGPIKALIRVVVLGSSEKKLPLLVRYAAFIHEA